MPEQRDPLEQLNQFGAGLGSGAGGPMPHSAADARRRGDQIRRRRSALVAGGAALAVAAVAVPIIALAGGAGDGDTDRDRVATSPSARPTALSTDDLLADGETAYGDWGDWQEERTVEGDGQAVTFDCQQQALGGLGATAEFSRFWSFAIDGVPNTEPYAPSLAEEVASFPDAASARAAYEEILGWVTDCSSLGGADEVRTFDPRPVDIPGGEGVIVDLQGTPAPAAVDPYGDSAYINETGLVLVDDRIAVLSLTIIGQDYNFLEEDGGTPMKRMLPVAAERLATGPNVPVLPESVADPGAATGDTVISDDFPLAAGWPDDAEAEPEEDGLTPPAHSDEAITLEACGSTAPDPLYNDRLMARWTNVEDYRTRYLTTYTSVAEAESAVRGIADLYRSCPEGEVRDDGFTPNWSVRETSVGDEAYAVFGWDELDGAPSVSGTRLLLVRVGNAVLVAVWSGEFGSPDGREDEIAAELSAETTAVIDAMCAFEARGC